MLGPTRCRATLRPCARPRDGPRLTVAAPRSQAYSEDWMLRCFSEHVDKRQQNILYADNLGGRPPARPSAPSRDLPFVLQEVHDLFIELLQSVPRSLIDFHVELDMLLQPPLLERPIISAPPAPPPPPPPPQHLTPTLAPGQTRHPTSGCDFCACAWECANCLLWNFVKGYATVPYMYIIPNQFLSDRT
jgi:hypothetical protein